VRAVPLLVSAQAVRVLAYLVALLSRSGWDPPPAIAPTALLLVAILIEILGYLDLSFRTAGAARIVLRLLAIAPVFYIVLAFALGATMNRAEVGSIGSFAAWAYSIHVLGGIVGLWLGARRMHAIALAAFALSLFGTVMTQLAPELLRTVLSATGLFGQGLLLFAPPVLIGILAIFAGESAEPLSIDTARAGRTLRRAPFGIAALAVWAIIVLVSDAVEVAACFAFVGMGVVVIAAYRARALRGTAATVITAYGLVVVILSVLTSARAHLEPPTSSYAAIVAAIGALMLVAVRAAPSRPRILAAIVFGALGVASLVLRMPEVDGVLFAAELLAMYVLRSAGRELAVVPPQTVADVFA
jgi:hypothetical protein